ncbi:MAG: FHA domain-containing protein [Planctomycetaceae bacterium]|jgi:hypothetical protein|nr:FHA domain-containing protein [Planctomycetaceae bacterium]
MRAASRQTAVPHRLLFNGQYFILFLSVRRSYLTMALVTIRIIDGPDRGKDFNQMAAPVAVGREEGNQIQLNDQRVSRNHLKIHEVDGTVLLTDLQSTNGTKVNGESVHVWQLQPGDLITAGRTQMLFGTASEIAARLSALTTADITGAVRMYVDEEERHALYQAWKNYGCPTGNPSDILLAKELFRNPGTDPFEPLQLLFPPNLPKDLLPQQAAEIEALLLYVHLRLRYLLATVHTAPSAPDSQDNPRITLSAAQWQNLVDLQAKITGILAR